MYCKKCGNQVNETKFCNNCGEPTNLNFYQMNNYPRNSHNQTPFQQSNNNINYQTNKNKKNSTIAIAAIVLSIIFFSFGTIFISKQLINKNNENDNHQNINQNNNNENEKNSTTRTFMIYMVGSDLESKGSLGTYDLEGINPKLVDLNNINVIMIAGGSSEWHNDYINAKETSIYKLTKNGFEKVKQQQIKNMGTSTTLSDFINYVTENYITDEYELLFWNHGGALLGSEHDEINNDILSLQEISQALSKTSFNKNKKMETIIFSTCLNGTIENANIFKDYADYFVASEEVSISWKYKSDFSFINKVTSKTSSLDIGKMFIKGYKDKIETYKKIYNIENDNYIYSTYSLVDLNNLDDLNKSVDDFFEKIDITTDYNTIAKVRSNLYQYGYSSSGTPHYDTVDLYNLISDLKKLSPKEAEKALDEIKETVIYNYATDDKSKGIGIYFPYNGHTSYQKMFLDMYDEISDIDNYNDFISDFNNLRTTNSSNKLSFKDNKLTINVQDTESDFELELTNEQVKNFAKAQYIVFRDNKDGTFLPVYKGSETKLENNILKAKIKDRQLKVRDITDDGEYPLILTEEEVGDTYIKYSTSAMLENLSSYIKWRMDAVKISLMLDKKTNDISITSIVLSSKDDLPGKGMVDLNDYTDIIFASSSYKITNADGTYNDNWESNGIIEGIEIGIGNYELKLHDYNDGYDYYSVFKIYDINNNTYFSNLIKMK